MFLLNQKTCPLVQQDRMSGTSFERCWNVVGTSQIAPGTAGSELRSTRYWSEVGSLAVGRRGLNSEFSVDVCVCLSFFVCF